MTTHHKGFEDLLQRFERPAIVQLTRTAVGHALLMHDEGERGDADQVITQATILAALAYQLVLQLGGNLDEELERYRAELRTGDRLTRAVRFVATTREGV